MNYIKEKIKKQFFVVSKILKKNGLSLNNSILNKNTTKPKVSCKYLYNLYALFEVINFESNRYI